MECAKMNCPMQAGTTTDRCGDNCPWRTTAKDGDLISRATAILIAERYGCNNGSALGHHSGAADCIAFEIATLPAVDAIPVEWLHKKREQMIDAAQNTPEQAIAYVLWLWKKEQEAQDG